MGNKMPEQESELDALILDIKNKIKGYEDDAKRYRFDSFTYAEIVMTQVLGDLLSGVKLMKERNSRTKAQHLDDCNYELEVLDEKVAELCDRFNWYGCRDRESHHPTEEQDEDLFQKAMSDIDYARNILKTRVIPFLEQEY